MHWARDCVHQSFTYSVHYHTLSQDLLYWAAQLELIRKLLILQACVPAHCQDTIWSERPTAGPSPEEQCYHRRSRQVGHKGDGETEQNQLPVWIFPMKGLSIGIVTSVPQLLYNTFAIRLCLCDCGAKCEEDILSLKEKEKHKMPTFMELNQWGVLQYSTI